MSGSSNLGELSGRSTELEDSYCSAPARAGSISRQRAAQTMGFRQQFASALQQHFSILDGSASAGDEEGVMIPCTPRSGKGGNGRLRFRGVTRHKRTQRYESHIWECKKQIYLGGFDSETLAAKAHDIMALRCKGGNSGDVLNFPREEYSNLLPTIERLSREDVITALRNYSKSQTCKRIGQPSSPTAPASLGIHAGAGAPRTASGGVQKVSSPRAPRRLPTMPTSVARKLSVNVRREPKPEEGGSLPAHTLTSHGSTATHAGSPRSFGGKVAPPRPRHTATAAAAAAAASPRGSPTAAVAAPATPQSRLMEAAAPVTPSAASPAGVFLPGAPRVLGLRWQHSAGVGGPYLQGPAAAAATAMAAAGLMPPHGSCLPAGESRAAAAAGAASAASLEPRQQYLAELYCHYMAQQQAQEQASQAAAAASFSGHGGAACYAGLAGGAGTNGFAYDDSDMSGGGSYTELAYADVAADYADVEVAVGPPACRLPPAAAAAAAGRYPSSPTSFEADMDCMFNKLLEEPSLTFSASDDAYLFAAMPAADPCCTAVEHVNGTMLFQEAPMVMDGSEIDSHGMPSEGSARALSPALQMETAWGQHAHPASRGGRGLGGADGTTPAAASAFEAAASTAAAVPAVSGGSGGDSRPSSPGALITVVPALSVPHPPPSVRPVSLAQAPSLHPQASLHPQLLPPPPQQLHAVYLQQHSSIVSPFALYASGDAPLA